MSILGQDALKMTLLQKYLIFQNEEVKEQSTHQKFRLKSGDHKINNELSTGSFRFSFSLHSNRSMWTQA